MTHAQQLREIAAEADSGRIGPHNVADKLNAIATELEALKAREPMTDEQRDALYRQCQQEVGQLQAECRYEFASWFSIAIRLFEAHHNITKPKDNA